MIPRKKFYAGYEDENGNIYIVTEYHRFDGVSGGSVASPHLPCGPKKCRSPRRCNATSSEKQLKWAGLEVRHLGVTEMTRRWAAASVAQVITPSVTLQLRPPVGRRPDIPVYPAHFYIEEKAVEEDNG